MTNKFNLVFTIAFLVACSASGQLTNPWNVPLYPYCLGVKQDGSVITGKLRGWSSSRGGYITMSLADSTGQTKTIHAKDMAYVIFYKKKFNRIPNIPEGLQNVKPADFKKYFGTEYLVYVRMGPLNFLYYLGELANIDYCEKIKVFFAPLNYSQSYRWWNGNQYPFFVEKNGITIKVRNGNYRKRFIELFHDCPELMKLPKSERKFPHLLDHVKIYDKFCG
jgi:hypothetical protein